MESINTQAYTWHPPTPEVVPEGTCHVLLIYTGGTIGMARTSVGGSLEAVRFREITKYFPSLNNFGIQLSAVAFNEPIDSSQIHPGHWQMIGGLIYNHYQAYDAFVVLHGTDTMAYSASALSFMFKGLNKPIVFTGAQLPLGERRSDARENLVTALEIASTRVRPKNSGKLLGRPKVSEVCIFFNSVLLRGNRAQKVQSVTFDAFESENYPELAVAGVTINWGNPHLKGFEPNAELLYRDQFDTNVALLKLFPGINKAVVEAVLNTKDLKGLILESYGAGNAPTDSWFTELLSQATERGVVILNVSQCNGGWVIPGHYAASKGLNEAHVLSGADMTTEAAVTKMMFLLATSSSKETEERVKYLHKKLQTSLRGELTPLNRR